MRPNRTWPVPMRERRGAGAPLVSNGPPPRETVGRHATAAGDAEAGVTRPAATAASAATKGTERLISVPPWCASCSPSTPKPIVGGEGDPPVVTLPSTRRLRREVAEDIGVDPALVRAEIAAPDADRSLLGLDRLERPALVGIRRGAVRVLRILTRVGALHGVPPVGPDRVGEGAERRHPEVVARQRHRPVVVLLVVRIGGHVGDPHLRGPGRTGIGGGRSEHVERPDRPPICAVADRPGDAVAGIVPAVPPDRVQDAAVCRDVRKHLVPDRLTTRTPARQCATPRTRLMMPDRRSSELLVFTSWPLPSIGSDESASGAPASSTYRRPSSARAWPSTRRSATPRSGSA